MGIGKVGQKYWQMQGRTDCKEDGLDVLEKAVEELKASKEEQKKVQEEYRQLQLGGIVETSDVRVELLDDKEETVEEVGGNDINDIDEEEEVEDVHKVKIEDEDEDEEVEDEEDEAHISEDDEIEQNSPHEGLKQQEEGEGDVEVEEEIPDVMDDGAEEPKWVHEQRVQESIEIYNRQRRMEKLKKEQKLSGSSIEEVVATFSTTQTTIDWNFETSQHASANDEGKKRVFWTEWMDLKLAELVQSCVFDFEAIANSFTELADSEEFLQLPPAIFGVGKHTKAILENLSEEDCRLRWAELDSKQWCDTDTDGDSATTNGLNDTSASAPAVYKVCIQPDVLGKGHGAQPTFSAMSNMATGLPSYLKVPTSFPSMSDTDSDADGDDDENNNDNLDVHHTSSNCERFEALD